MRLGNISIKLTSLIFLALIVCSQSFALQQNVPIVGPKNSTEQFSGISYGPIDSDDTLWAIAERYRQNKNLTVYQVMVGIYELNTDAFADNNINHLIDGKILKLPSERYIARIDPANARLKAAQDEASWQPSLRPGNSLNNLKPPRKLASTEDLDQTKQQIEERLRTIDELQRREFENLKQQFGRSIDDVQSLLDENQKLYERLDKVDTDIDELRNRVGQDGQIQQQMEQVIGLQNELLAISQQAEQQRIEQEQNKYAFLSSPVTIAIVAFVLTALAMIGFGIWAVRRNKQTSSDDTVLPASSMSVETVATATAAAQVNPLDEKVEEEKSDDDLFGDDSLLDDVLDDSLDDSFSDDLETFDDLDDEMLVPDGKDEALIDEFEEGSDELDQDDLDSLFDSDDDEQSEFDGIDLSQTDEDISSDLAADDELNDELLKELDNELPDEIDELGEPAQIESIDDDSQPPEVSIDEVLEEATEKEEPNLDDDQVLAELDSEIDEKGKELDDLADELLEELDQAPIPNEESSDEEEPEALLETEQDDLADELLAEFGIDGDEGAENEERNESEQNEESQEAEQGEIKAEESQDDVVRVPLGAPVAVRTRSLARASASLGCNISG